jgi:hypothetical protein
VGEEPHKEPPPDIELGVSLRARTLRFETVPEVETGYEGNPGHDVRTEGERDGLPDQVKTGVTYRRVRIRGRATLRIKDVNEEHPVKPGAWITSTSLDDQDT